MDELLDSMSEALDDRVGISFEVEIRKHTPETWMEFPDIHNLFHPDSNIIKLDKSSIKLLQDSLNSLHSYFFDEKDTVSQDDSYLKALVERIRE